MSENWQPGDVAICIDAEPRSPEIPRLPLYRGSKYTVTRVYSVFHRGKIRLVLGLLETRNPYPEDGGFAADRFKKQPPLVYETETARELELTK